MVGTCVYLLDTSESTKFTDQLGFEVSALVTQDSFWEAVMYQELLPKTLCYCCCFLILRWKCNSIFRVCVITVITKMSFVFLLSGSKDK